MAFNPALAATHSSRPLSLVPTLLTLALACAAGLRSHAADLPPGTRPCVTNVAPAGYGTFLFLKSASFAQNSAAQPTPAATPLPAASIELVSPSAFFISNAVVIGPASFEAPLTLQTNGASTWTNAYPTEAALDDALRAGPWSSSFKVLLPNAEPVVGFFPFLITSNLPPVPQVANYPAAQAINPSAAFTLDWIPWMGSTTNDRIRLEIVNAAGQSVFAAATDCAADETLVPGATSATVPAGRLTPGSSYSGYLTFGASLLTAQDDSALLVMRGVQSRTTRFTLRTSGSSGGQPATLGVPRVSGTNLTFSITGTPGGIHQVQSSANLGAWTDEIQVTLPASGTAEVSLPLQAGTGPRFYRAIAVGGPPPPVGDPATLGLTLTATNQLTLSITGTPGGTYRIESTTNFQAWVQVQEVILPASTNRILVTFDIPAGVPSQVFRAVAASGPPPAGNAPTLVLARDGTGLRLSATGGDPQRTYSVEKNSPSFGAWTDTGITLTTDASGAGSVTLTPAPTENAAFYRTRAP